MLKWKLIFIIEIQNESKAYLRFIHCYFQVENIGNCVWFSNFQVWNSHNMRDDAHKMLRTLILVDFERKIDNQQ